MRTPSMNLISETHYSFERREYAFMVLREYTIISRASHTYTPRLGYSRNSFLYIKKKKKKSWEMNFLIVYWWKMNFLKFRDKKQTFGKI